MMKLKYNNIEELIKASLAPGSEAEREALEEQCRAVISSLLETCWKIKEPTAKDQWTIAQAKNLLRMLLYRSIGDMKDLDNPEIYINYGTNNDK